MAQFIQMPIKKWYGKVGGADIGTRFSQKFDTPSLEEIRKNV